MIKLEQKYISQRLDLGERFENVGLSEPAVRCYEKAGEIKKALDCCVLLN